MVACGSKEESINVEGMTFEELVEAAKGSTVTFYGWGGDDLLNAWLKFMLYYASAYSIKFLFVFNEVLI